MAEMPFFTKKPMMMTRAAATMRMAPRSSMNTNHCAYESQHEPKNIKVQGLRGRWDVCLHAVEKNGTREYWWVLNADGVDGEEGYWTTRKAKGEYKYFCDAGWGDADNAITHLEEELAD